MRMKTSAESKRTRQGVKNPTHLGKKDAERSVGHGVRTHQERFDQDRVAKIDSKHQDKFIEKVKAREKQHGLKEHE